MLTYVGGGAIQVGGGGQGRREGAQARGGGVQGEEGVVRGAQLERKDFSKINILISCAMDNHVIPDEGVHRGAQLERKDFSKNDISKLAWIYSRSGNNSFARFFFCSDRIV